VFAIIGDDDAAWYLNGKKIEKFQSQLDVPHAGVNVLTAKKGRCSQTIEVFIEE